MSGLVELVGVTKRFQVANGRELWAVKDVSLTIEPGESVGLVGESGSGKTTLGRLIMLLTRPTAGAIWFRGVDLTRASRHDLKELRGRRQMVFQDPRDALNPRLRIASSIAEPLEVVEPHLGRRKARGRVEEAAELVSFSRGHLDRLPHELSAGEQQRAALARAIVTRPAFVVLDEPTSMLDASLRAGMVRTFADLQATLGISFLFISHDFVSVAALSHRIAVMYLAEIVELGPTHEILRNPLHPYSRALLSAVPVIARQQVPPAVVLAGEIPSPIDRPDGCPLATRCPFVEERCRLESPRLAELEPSHSASCFVAADRLPRGEWPPVDTPGRALSERLAHFQSTMELDVRLPR